MAITLAPESLEPAAAAAAGAVTAAAVAAAAAAAVVTAAAGVEAADPPAIRTDWPRSSGVAGSTEDDERLKSGN